MKKIFIILIAFISLIYANDIKFYQPSFDCTNVIKDSLEYKICINEELSNLDKVLSILYEKLLKMVPKEELISEQKEFLKNRGLCDTNSCIKQSYENRIYILNNIYSLLNTNLSDYKSKKLSNTENFINLQDDIKSHIFVNTLLEKINIFDKNNYILLDNGFFFKDLYSNGTYYANTKTGKMQKIYTWIEPWVIIKNSNSINLVIRDSGGNRGLGYESIINLTINNEDSIEKNTIISVDYDMESGLCGRPELGLKEAGDIENFKYDEKTDNLIIDLTQQDCSNNKIEKKQLIYNFNSKDFINSNINSDKVEKNKISKFSKIEIEIENDEYKECMANSGGGSMISECTQPIIEKYENKIKLLDKEVINSIKSSKNGFFEELPKYYKKNETDNLRQKLENIYKNNSETWEKYKLTYYEFINNTYGIQDGTMWAGFGDSYKIRFLKDRLRMILDMKNKIEKGD